MKNLIIDTGARLDKDIETFKVSAVEKEKNFTSARIRVCRDPETLAPMIFYSQELNRNFKNPSDPMAMRHVIKSFEPDYVNASTDTALEFKFNDAILAHEDRIDEYNPLTDIHSNEMNLFVDEDSATYLSDMGIDIDHVGNEFQGIQSVEASPYVLGVAGDVYALKRQLADAEKKLSEVKRAMLDELGIDGNIDDTKFETLISQHLLSAHWSSSISCTMTDAMNTASNSVRPMRRFFQKRSPRSNSRGASSCTACDCIFSPPRV